jgi:hypothetical protein
MISLDCQAADVYFGGDGVRRETQASGDADAALGPLAAGKIDEVAGAGLDEHAAVAAGAGGRPISVNRQDGPRPGGDLGVMALHPGADGAVGPPAVAVVQLGPSEAGEESEEGGQLFLGGLAVAAAGDRDGDALGGWRDRVPFQGEAGEKLGGGFGCAHAPEITTAGTAAVLDFPAMTIDDLWANITAGAYALTDAEGEAMVAAERTRRAGAFEVDLLAAVELAGDPRAPEILSLSRRLAGGPDAPPAAVAEAIGGLAKILRAPAVSEVVVKASPDVPLAPMVPRGAP